MAYQAAKFEIKRAALSGDFGRDLASKWFNRTPESLVEQFGAYKSGPRKGLCRGYVVWLKIHEGGWVRRVGSRGFVLHPSVRARVLLDNEALARMMNGPDPLDALISTHFDQDPKELHDRAMRNAIQQAETERIIAAALKKEHDDAMWFALAQNWQKNPPTENAPMAMLMCPVEL